MEQKIGENENNNPEHCLLFMKVLMVNKLGAYEFGFDIASQLQRKLSIRTYSANHGKN